MRSRTGRDKTMAYCCYCVNGNLISPRVKNNAICVYKNGKALMAAELGGGVVADPNFDNLIARHYKSPPQAPIDAALVLTPAVVPDDVIHAAAEQLDATPESELLPWHTPFSASNWAREVFMQRRGDPAMLDGLGANYTTPLYYAGATHATLNGAIEQLSKQMTPMYWYKTKASMLDAVASATFKDMSA